MPHLFWGLIMLPDLYIDGFSSLIGECSLEDFAPFLQARSLRRADSISKNVLLCSFRAMQQAGLNGVQHKDTGISLAMGAGALTSTVKFMDSIIEDGDELSSPTAFASSVHNSAALVLSVFLNIKGPCVITGQFDSSFAAALLTARQFIAKEMCRKVLLAATEDINPLVADILCKDNALLAPFIYCPHLPPKRAAAAFIVSAKPTDKTLFVLKNISLGIEDNSAKAQEQNTPDIQINSCAHTALSLAEYLKSAKPFAMHDTFAGAVLNINGEPYVQP